MEIFHSQHGDGGSSSQLPDAVAADLPHQVWLDLLSLPCNSGTLAIPN